MTWDEISEREPMLSTLACNLIVGALAVNDALAEAARHVGPLRRWGRPNPMLQSAEALEVARSRLLEIAGGRSATSFDSRERAAVA